MAQVPDSDKEANVQPKPSALPSPRRGAFPTPKIEIENAKPYVRESDRADDQSVAEPVSPETVDP